MDVGRTIQSALHPAGPHAEAVANLTWVLVAGATAIMLLVIGFATYALLAPHERRAWIANRRFVVVAGIVFPLVTLAALLVYTLAVARSLAHAPEPAAVRIEVIGEQWWWRVHYLDQRGAIDFTTANEIRIPVNAPVDIALKSGDVLHSFWVPNLAGKVDMIPGRVNRLRVQAARTGIFRGQCAEYCGGPHAKMAFYVIAHAPDEFERWRELQRRPAAEAADAQLRRGRELVLARCAACHTIRGTDAEGALGPDLTHVGGRLTLAAGILANNRANLSGWIVDTQKIKPGNLMPPIGVFTGEELRAVAAYLESLK